MGIFNFLNKPKIVTDPLPIGIANDQTLAPIPERTFVETTHPVPANDIEANPTEPLDNNINLLFNFMDRNHEAKGYDDALINSDSSHLAQNLDALKNELERTIKKVKTFYEDFILEIDYHITSRSRSGMIDMVEELEMKKQIALSHINKIVEIEESTINNTGDCKGILISYTRGFKNGLAAISHHTILKRKF